MEVINRTLARLRDHLGMDIAYISELNGPDMIIRAHCAPNLPQALPEQFSLPREHGFCHYLVKGDIPSIIHDSSKNPVTVDLPTRRDFAIEAYIGLPLERTDGSTYGTLCCLSHKPNHTLNDRDLETVKLFAEFVVEQIDTELEDRRLSEERRSRIQSVFDDRLLRSKFQPIVRLSDGSLKGFEALARFDTDPYQTPDKWFAEAAHIDRGIELELEAVRCALKGVDHLPNEVSVGLNVSPACLVSEELGDLLLRQRGPKLTLELTEHAKVQEYASLVERIGLYKDAGYLLAVDDAGAGYASLTHILQLQPDFIKLDMSLTRDIHLDRVRRSLANALVLFANETNAAIVAEGIETSAERDTLAELGVDFGQGYFFDRPLEIDAAADLAKLGGFVVKAA